MFYTRLQPYGDWIETDNYGYVYQPREAGNSRWRPYTDGRWVYSDAGWTWVSNEPFGWATYHYGRWSRLRGIGWVWVPGSEWAPAWVSWRTGGQYVGWAPLPPEAHFDRATGIRNWSDSYYDVGPEQYVFVPAPDFGEERIERAIVPPQQNVTIVNDTKNVTNITYNNTTVVNQGPNYEQLRAQSRAPIPQLRLEREAIAPAQGGHAVVQDNAVVIPAPVVAPAAAAEQPPAVKQTIKQAAVDRGWGAINNQQAEQMRAKMNSEATPPPNAPPKTSEKPAALPERRSSSSPAAAEPVAPTAPAAAATTPAVTITPAAAHRPVLTSATPTPETSSTPPLVNTTPASATATPAIHSTPLEDATPVLTPHVSARPFARPEMTARITPPPRQTAGQASSARPMTPGTAPIDRTPVTASPAAPPAHRTVPFSSPAPPVHSPATTSTPPGTEHAPATPPNVHHGPPPRPSASPSPGEAVSATPANSPEEKNAEDRGGKKEHLPKRERPGERNTSPTPAP